MTKDAIEAAIDNLASYLAAQVTGLTVIKEWPSANQALAFPTVSIFSNNPQYTNLQPYSDACTLPNAQNQVTTTWVVGEWDTTLQLDVWCRNKMERRTIGKAIKDAINKNVNPQGLSLQMADYFNAWARFDMSAYQLVDDEAGSQRQEYRTRIALLLNVKEMAQTTDYAIINANPITQDQISVGSDVQIP